MSDLVFQIHSLLPVIISGGSGGTSDLVNGTYLPTGERLNDKPVFVKDGDSNKWLLCCKNCKWMVTDTACKNENDIKGWATSVDYGVGHPSLVKQWKIVQEGKFLVQETVSAKSSVRCIFSFLKQRTTG